MDIPFRKRCRRAVRSCLIRATVRAISLLPLPLARRLGRLSAHLGWFLSRRTHRLTLEHLNFAFPNLSEAERRRIGHANFVHLGEGMMEAVCIRQIDPVLEEYVELSGPGLELLRSSVAAGHGVVFATGHMGHWELLARRIARAGCPPVVVAKRSWDARIDAAVDRFRLAGGVTTLWRDDPGSARLLLHTMREGKALGLLIDQDTQVQGVFVPFFGRPAHTPRAAAELALRFGAPLVVGWTRRRPDRRGYVVELEPVAYDTEADREAEVVRLTAACTARLEAAVRAHPSEWVWMHRRWKTQPKAETAPPQVSQNPEGREGCRPTDALASNSGQPG